MKKCPDSEPIKLLLEHKNLQYTDVGIKKSEWPVKREEIITHRVPALRIQHTDGQLEWMSESKAILRGLGIQYNLLGRTSMEMYHCDRMIGKIMEADALLKEFHKNKKHHEVDRDEYKQNLIDGIVIILQHIDRMLQEAPGEFAAADIITIADFYLLNFVDFLTANNAECLKNYPFMIKWRKHLIQNDQAVAKYTASRCWDII